MIEFPLDTRGEFVAFEKFDSNSDARKRHAETSRTSQAEIELSSPK
jgi:hypothetical protein